MTPLWAEVRPCPVPGLAVARHPHSGRWWVIHAESGLSPCPLTTFDTPEAALGLAEFLRPGLDWTRPAAKLRRDRACREKVQQVAAAYGREWMHRLTGIA